MRSADVIIIGGGLAGSTAAAMLGRAGVDVVLVDPHELYPPDFRCEKLDGTQTRILEKTGLLPALAEAATPDRECWVARFGRVIDKRPGDQLGIMYHDLVNTIRAEIPAHVRFVRGKATAVSTSDSLQEVTLSVGENISARLVVVANGLNIGLQHKLGISRTVLSANHSISVGFDMKPTTRPTFDFPALTYYYERTSERMAYLTLFPIGTAMRANLFGYRDFNDPWIRQIHQSPQEALFTSMPGLRKLTGEFEVSSAVKVRPIDLYVTEGYLQSGIVLVGDAFSTSCPAAGTGARKSLNDVERLCNVHIPKWLSTNGMNVAKVAEYYADPVKVDCDRTSFAKAYELRSFSIDPGVKWTAMRWAKFVLHAARGAVRQRQGRLDEMEGDAEHVPGGPLAPHARSPRPIP